MLLLLALACVPKKDFEALSAEAVSAREELTAQRTHSQGRIIDLDAALAEALARSAALEGELTARQGELERLNAEQASLLKDRSRLKSSVEEMESALNDLSLRKRIAEERVTQYQDLLGRFQSLIDAGKLSVSIVDGRMVVQLATDILFGSGSAELSKDGAVALTEVAGILASIPDRRYQIEGHTDNVPIATAQYPSNWELASARSIVVLKAMLTAGLSGDRVSASSFADTRPVAANDSKTGRTANRRIEIVVVPDLSQLPGFEELQAVAGE
ncbi:MAG: chemotaxis protein MotB [Myxococcota bacterium]|jgi:chemotaxis protein MotB